MGSISDFLENRLLDHLCNVAFTPAATIYVALCTGDPGEAGTAGSMSECTATAQGYARQPITFSAAVSRRVVQSGAVTFPQATGAWGLISHWALVSSVSGAGDMYAYGNFVSNFSPVAGNTPTIPSTEIEVEIRASTYTATTISAASADNSLNDSALGFPLWPAGTVILISGFTGTPANNSLATVTSSTTSKIIVSGVTFVNDAAGESVTLALSGGFSDYLVHNWLNRAFRNQAFAKPATYVGLSTKGTPILDSDVSGSAISEVSTAGTNYARVLVNTNVSGTPPKWTVSSGGALTNVEAITFNTPSAGWGTVTSMFLADALTAGNVLGYDNASILDQSPISGDTVQFAINALDLAIS